jgi:hypothetical protein
LDKESWWKLTENMIARAEKFGIWSGILQQASMASLRVRE